MAKEIFKLIDLKQVILRLLPGL